MAPQPAPALTSPASGGAAHLVSALEECRTAERAQAVFYRALAAAAGQSGDVALALLAERFNELQADEQHHLSRLTARLSEIGAVPREISREPVAPATLQGWEAELLRRERGEIARYEALLAEPLDTETRSLIRQILETERMHAKEQGGKWMPA